MPFYKHLLMLISISFFSLMPHATVEAKSLAEHVLALEDQAGKKPTIIALSPHIVEILFELGAGDQIIGTTDYADYPAQALGIERVGNAVKLKLEKIIALNPDLIIAWTSGNPAQDLDKLKRLGFTVLYSQPDNFIELATEIKQFGLLTGNKTQADRVSETLTAQYHKLVATYQHTQPVTVFYEVWHQPLTTVAANAWPQHHLTICNADNPFAQAALDYPQVSIESLVQKNIQAIIQPTSPQSNNRVFFDWAAFSTLPAVKHNNIIQANADALHRMTTRSLDEVARLCSQIDLIRQATQ